MQQSITDLKRPVENVDDCVLQSTFLTRISEDFQTYRDKIDLFGNFQAILGEQAYLKPKKEDKDNQN